MTTPAHTAPARSPGVNDRDHAEAVQRIEDHTAEMLDARESCTDLELYLRAMARRGLVDAPSYDAALSHLNRIRRALELGRVYAGKARRSPLE